MLRQFFVWAGMGVGRAQLWMYIGRYYILKSHGASIEVLALCKFDVRNAGESCYVIVQFIEVGRAQDEAKIRLSDRMAALVKSKRGIKSVLAAT